MRDFLFKLLGKESHVIKNHVGTAFSLKNKRNISRTKNDYIDIEILSATLHITNGRKVLESPIWFRKTIFKRHASEINKEIKIDVELGVYSADKMETNDSYQEAVKRLSKKGADIVFIQKTIEELVNKLYF